MVWVYVRNNIEKSSEEMGRGLAGAAEVAVFWPTSAELPKEIATHYPKMLPPLRADRDSILVGEMKSFVGEGQVVLHGKMDGKEVDLQVAVNAGAKQSGPWILAIVMD